MPKIGDALKRAVRQAPEIQQDAAKARPSSAIMNPNRLRIFQYLCLNTCATPSQIAKGTGLSQSTVNWHLASLMDSGYAHEFIIGKKSLYCPRGLISGKNIQMYAILANEKNLAIFKAILVKPGSDSVMISSVTGIPVPKVRICIKALCETNLVTRLGDGRHVRFFPTERYGDAIAEEARARKEYARGLVWRLSSEHLRPELDDLKGPGIVITLSIMDNKEKIVIPPSAHSFE